MDIKQEVAQRHSALIDLRRDFHQHPELAFEETRTAGIIAERLRASGLEVRAGIAKTGVVGVLRGGQPGKTLAIRADIDALPVQEENELPFKSKTPGKMHACGHDTHAAIALTLADLLAAHRDELRGNVTFLFQPAEERISGAQPMIADGALKNPDVDAVIGLHIASRLPVGQIVVRSGAGLASADSFNIRVCGRAGHGAMPHLSVDPILAASEIIVALQSLVSREVSPFQPAVITIGSFHGGTARNVIADEVVLEGTFRTFDEEVRTHLTRRIEELARQVAASVRATASFELLEGCPPCVSDEEMCHLVRRAAAETVGAQNTLDQVIASASDDMAYFLNAVPGCYFSLGAQDSAYEDSPHHSPRFRIDEAGMPLGVEVMARAALEYLG
ncbi:MAG TPA: M20 family metallopeptidase [Ktedonobacterales bacterium]|jgi:amidohydrolase